MSYFSTYSLHHVLLEYSLHDIKTVIYDFQINKSCPRLSLKTNETHRLRQNIALDLHTNLEKRTTHLSTSSPADPVDNSAESNHFKLNINKNKLETKVSLICSSNLDAIALCRRFMSLLSHRPLGQLVPES